MKLSAGLAAVALLLAPATVLAQQWDGGGTDSNWNTAANWVNNVLPANNGTADIVLSTVPASRLAIVMNVPWHIRSLKNLVPNQLYSLNGGNTLTVSAGMEDSANPGNLGPTAFNNPLALSAPNLWTVNGTFNVNGGVALDAHTLTLAAAGTVNLGGPVSGTGRLLGRVPIGGRLDDGTVTHTLRFADARQREHLRGRGHPERREPVARQRAGPRHGSADPGRRERPGRRRAAVGRQRGDRDGQRDGRR